MRLIKFKLKEIPYWGLVTKEDMILTDMIPANEFSDFEGVINHYKDGESYGESISLSEVEIDIPVMPSKNILCIGKNYVDHILEFDGRDEAHVIQSKANPVFFTKALSTLNAANKGIDPHEGITNELDYEGELAVVIGKVAKNISKEEALDYVYGYTILNDVTARDLQRDHQQWFKGKSLDTFCPVGPWIVTSDDLQDPQKLDIKTTVDGEIRQNSNTSLMIHKVADLIAELSRGLTLNPGDVIATGTPSGVGMGFNPKKLLVSGSIVEVEIEGIGVLKNHVI